MCDVLSPTGSVPAHLQEEARQACSELMNRDPLAQECAFAMQCMIRDKRRVLSLMDVLDLEFRVATKMLSREQFFEGVRALLLEKDIDPVPHHQYDSLSDVPPELVRFFLTTPPALLSGPLPTLKGQRGGGVVRHHGVPPNLGLPPLGQRSYLPPAEVSSYLPEVDAPVRRVKASL
ncbi:MAG: hypothetical protein MHM6MM_007167 [Cercozoa sp. M6MM]